MNDGDLLQAYRRSNSDSAFNELVQRHAPMVYSVARRVLGASPLAEEATQVVFILLARKARTLSESTILVGWLHRTAYLTSLKMLRDESRRKKREQESVAMNANSPEPRTDWQAMSGKLDEAIACLDDNYRLPILLRFFQNRSMRQIGDVLGISENAAKMRVARATDRLRDSLKKSGVTCSSAALAVWLAENSVQAIPPGVLSAVLSGASNTTTAPAASITLFTQELLLLMTKSKIGFIGLSLMGALLLSVTGLSVYNRAHNPPEPPLAKEENDVLAKVKADRLAGQTTRRTAHLQGGDTQAAPNQARILKRLKEVLYSKGKNQVLPPPEIAELMNQLGPDKRAAFDITVEALRSGDFAAQLRAASSMHFFHTEYGPEVANALQSALESSHDRRLCVAFASAIWPEGDGSAQMPALAKIMESNPASREGVRNWFDRLLRQNPSSGPLVANQLLPLLDNTDANLRFHAACVLSQLPSVRDARLVDNLLPPFKLPEGPAILSSEEVVAACSALRALKNLGPQANSAAALIRQFDSQLQPAQCHSYVIDTLAAIAPELAAENPEIAAKLKRLASASDLNNQSAINQASVNDLVSALQNPEGRGKAADALGNLGPSAAAALPALRSLLNAENKDDRPDAANYLFNLAQTIRKIDPAAPVYYHHDDLNAPLMEVLQHIDVTASEPQKLLKAELEKRLFGSNRPFETKEIIDLIDKCQKTDTKLGETIVGSLRDYTKSRGGIVQSDPVLAKVIASGDTTAP